MKPYSRYYFRDFLLLHEINSIFYFRGCHLFLRTPVLSLGPDRRSYCIYSVYISGPQRQQEALWQSGHPEPPSTFRLWPMRQKEFHSGLRLSRHFEEFLRIRLLQSEAPQCTRPWGNLPPCPPFLCEPDIYL